jgi:hypothetical protein
MAFTRFHDDPYRIQMQVENASFQGRYMLDTPGAGLNLPFEEDPQIRLQKWGANLQKGAVNIESDLRGLTRPLNRDHVNMNIFQEKSLPGTIQSFSTATPFVEESRASHPAWTYKDLEQNRWEHPWLNPLNGLDMGFQSNIQTRILEKDYHSENLRFSEPFPLIQKSM